MGRAINKWPRTVSATLLLATLWGCSKKTDEPAPAASVAAVAEQIAAAASAAAIAQAAAASAAAAQAAAAQAAAAVPPAVASVTPTAPAVGDVKRFADKEKASSGTTKVALDESKIYDEPDNTKPSVASLSKDLVVTRLATLGTDWALVEFPSGVGKVSPGWIETKQLVAQPAIASSAKPATSASAKPATSAAPSASAAAVAPSASAPAKVRVKPGAVLRPPK